MFCRRFFGLTLALAIGICAAVPLFADEQTQDSPGVAKRAPLAITDSAATPAAPVERRANSEPIAIVVQPPIARNESQPGKPITPTAATAQSQNSATPIADTVQAVPDKPSRSAPQDQQTYVTPIAEVNVADDTVKVVKLFYAEPQQLIKILGALGVKVNVSESPKALIITGPEKKVDLASGVIRELDRAPEPAQNVEVTIYFVRAANEEIPNAKPLPEALNPPKEQIQSIFGLSHFSLTETVLLRGRDNSHVEASGFLPSAAPNDSGTPNMWKAQIGTITVGGKEGAPARISLNEFNVTMSVPVNLGGVSRRTETNGLSGGGIGGGGLGGGGVGGGLGGGGTGGQPGAPTNQRIEYRDAGLKADLDVTETQMAVIGKESMSTNGDSMFVIVSAHVVKE